MSNMYKKAGVDVEKGYEAVARMKRHIEKTNRPEVIGGIGAFAGLFDLTSLSYKEPVLVSGTDGVGTKLKLAFQLNKHDTVGIDLVAMCVNDIVAQGAEPLFFLDYIGCGKNDPEVIEQIVSGVSEGCVQAGASLIGGETAEMPGMYEEDEYDLAGFVVGIAEKSKLITGETIEAGDAIVGIASSGIHSNGYSLVRQVVKGFDLQKQYDGLAEPLGDALLRPTKIYAKEIKQLLEKVTVKGIAHITGGGFYENFPRMLPDGLGVKLDETTWDIPDILSFIEREGEINHEEMYGVFNMGIGMALAVNSEEAEETTAILRQNGVEATIIGEVTTEEGVHIQWASK
ncbi:MAG TPA: phosphoribosylformylglycinamidine cyclo-ligase [Pseudogracilibacillus sp.]|nr:phosphoribosylformylglycinamidine cyclo-ligase [Pseudogracilibacillus sp.]